MPDIPGACQSPNNTERTAKAMISNVGEATRAIITLTFAGNFFGAEDSGESIDDGWSI